MPIDKEELLRWERAARKDNPSFWPSSVVVELFNRLNKANELLSSAIQEIETLNDEEKDLRNAITQLAEDWRSAMGEYPLAHEPVIMEYMKNFVTAVKAITVVQPRGGKTSEAEQPPQSPQSSELPPGTRQLE